MLVVHPTKTHVHTIILLHGLGSNANDYYTKTFELFNTKYVKLIYLQAPVRYITCYESRMRAWHDYYTDNSQQALEDEINLQELREFRNKVHALIYKENIDYKNIFLWGESQGACCSLDIGLSFPHTLGAIYSSFGYLYSHTDIVSRPPIYAFHGSKDTIIPFALMKNSWRNLSVTIEYAAVQHTVPTAKEHKFMTSFINKYLKH